ncbi:aminoacyl-histidine dipeptidase [Clostridium polyendosporum]|uniref:Cytosol non-specific dipeptidase n=1 Tax=Clostridium polyendosporum TaxID=69208 RepID=A0A919RZ36_9CLOT|nr:aminoacyl-histidine dipeptidase [Clostridium polyendosporum]GIM29195.1 aminoacyl-histidine dipeptidase [Clostridium polyendosporum]
MEILADLHPRDVFKYFEEISAIPRGSGNEKQISDYLVGIGKKLGLEVIQDSALNVIIKKSGTSGYENAPTVILQGHMDMVCEKNKDTIHDFQNDPIKLTIDGDYIYATGTTLGADNGIAVAYALAILASNDIDHPPLEIFITTDEETGMGGAMTVNPQHLKGKILINLDSEEEGYLLVSCAGGIRNKVSLDIQWEEPKEKNLVLLEIRVRGLKGGHSGMEINRERGNSNKIMGRILIDLLQTIDFRLASLNGGSKNNAIPREHDARLLVEKDKVELVKERIEFWNKTLKNELSTSDSGIRVECEALDEKYDKIFSKYTTENAVKLLYLIPNGVNTMSMDIEGLVESSTNLGVVTTTDILVEYDSSARSSVGSLKEELIVRTRLIAELLGAELSTTGNYPEWKYNANSKIRTICQRVYKEMTGEDAKILAIHAGLECGLFTERLGADVDMISFGPNMYDVHTPNEHLSISSVKNVWDFLLNVLKELK